MKLKEIYELAIRLGEKADPRPQSQLKKLLRIEKKKFEKLPPLKKKLFDKEKLKHLYSDTRIHFGSPGKKIKKILAGIDIDGSELFLAQKLGVDLVISHHPLGRSLANLQDVMNLQADLLASYGVPINVAENLLEPRISEVARGIAPLNHYKVVDLAEKLDVPLVSIHTPLDNLCFQFLKEKIENKEPETVGDIIELLLKIPEYKEAAKRGNGPKIFAGKEDRRAGKMALTEITGGTEGAPQIYEWLTKAGIGTVVGMHMKEEHKKEAEKAHLNVVIAGHIASDSLGFNLFLDELEKQNIEVIPVGGLIRIRRI